VLADTQTRLDDALGVLAEDIDVEDNEVEGEEDDIAL
jgi:hypothetical protein